MQRAKLFAYVNNNIDRKRILQDKQFHRQLKSQQKEIIQNVLERKDSMAVLPTGFGKSMCYVLPFLDKARSYFFLMVICNSLLLLKSLPINAINCIKCYVNCSALPIWSYIKSKTKTRTGIGISMLTQRIRSQRKLIRTLKKRKFQENFLAAFSPRNQKVIHQHQSVNLRGESKHVRIENNQRQGHEIINEAKSRQISRTRQFTPKIYEGNS